MLFSDTRSQEGHSVSYMIVIYTIYQALFISTNTITITVTVTNGIGFVWICFKRLGLYSCGVFCPGEKQPFTKPLKDQKVIRKVALK